MMTPTLALILLTLVCQPAQQVTAKSFLQIQRHVNIDDQNAEAAEMARLEAQSDKDMAVDDDETTQADDASDNSVANDVESDEADESSDPTDDEEESFVQTKRNIDDENAEAAELARLEAQSDKDMDVDDDETAKVAVAKAVDSETAQAFIQVKQVKRNIDDQNAEAAEMARLEAQSDKDMDVDDDADDKATKPGSSGQEESFDEQPEAGSDDQESFVQTKRNIDDENAESAEMARLEAQSDKDMDVDDDDEATKADAGSSGQEESFDEQAEAGSDDQESFVQTKRNIDDENAEAAEMARLEAQSDKDMDVDDDETAKADNEGDSKAGGEESFIQVKQVKRNIDDQNAEAAEMARLEAQSDKDMDVDDDDTTNADTRSEETANTAESSDSSDDEEESFVQTKRNIDDENAEAAEMARLEAQSDKDMDVDDDDEATKAEAGSSGQEESFDEQAEAGSDDKESFIQVKQVKRNIDDENAEAAEMARLEAQSDKDLDEAIEETAKADESGDNKMGDEESFIQVKQVKRNIDDQNAEAAEMARLEAQSDKDMDVDEDESTQADDASDNTVTDDDSANADESADSSDDEE